ncbi:MAG: DUF3696 domain-containing protein [Balneolales bacterium]
MIKNINLKNFKAFESLNIELRPLTFFLGPNNSGKSSILSAIRILSQTMESLDTNVPLLLNGSLGDFGTYKDVVFNNHRGKKLGIGITLSPIDHVLRRDIKEINVQLFFKYRSGRREVILHSTELNVNGNPLIVTEYSIESEKQIIQKIGKKIVPSKLKSSFSKLLSFNNFLPHRIINRIELNESVAEFLGNKEEKIFRSISRVPFIFQRTFRNIEYVGAIRISPSRTFLYTGEGRASVGANGQFAANILALDAAKGGKRSRNIIQKVKKWLQQAGMASDIKVVSISDRHYEIKIQHPDSLEYQNYADVGFGHSQVLPILIAGNNIPQRGLFLVEQPEIHLHPKAQSELGDYFLQLHDDKVQSLVETHSEHLILRLQQHVIEGKINPKDIIFYYVHSKDGKKTVKELELDENGKFISDWPDGFFPERLYESKKIAQLRYKKSLE